MFQSAPQTRRSRRRDILPLPQPAAPYRDPVAGTLALELANTVEARGDRQNVDYLHPGYGNVVAWAHVVGLIDDGAAQALLHLAKDNPRDAVTVRRRMLALRDAIVDVFTDPDRADDALVIIQAEWRLAEPQRTLVRQPDRGAQWVWPDAITLESPLWPIVLDTISLLTEGPIDRVRQCGSSTCNLLFLDTTKNGSRRFCSTARCGTRTRVARHREAHR